MFFIPGAQIFPYEPNVTDCIITLNRVYSLMKRASRKNFLDKNYYTLSCYSSCCCNTFGELSAANQLVS